MAVDFAIAVAAMLLEPASVKATVLVFKSAVCAAALVVMPVAMVTVHAVPADRVAPPAVNVIVAVAPDPDEPAVKDVDPQPLVDGEPRDPNVKSGRTIVIVSEAASAAFRVNWYEMDDAVDFTGEAMVSTSFEASGSAIAVDFAIAVAAMLLEPASVKATVLVFKSAVCAAALVVMPVAMVTVHAVPADRVAPPAVNVIVAVAPDPDEPAVKDVDPQPLVDGEPRDPNIKSGRTIVIVSEAASAAFRANRSDTEETAAVTGFKSVSWL